MWQGDGHLRRRKPGSGSRRFYPIPGNSQSAFLPLHSALGEALLGARACRQRVWSINQLGGREASFSFLYSIPFQHIANEEMVFFPDVTVMVCGQRISANPYICESYGHV